MQQTAKRERHAAAEEEPGLAARLGRPAGSWPALDRLGALERKHLGDAIAAAGAAHEQALWSALPAWLRIFIRQAKP